MATPIRGRVPQIATTLDYFEGGDGRTPITPFLLEVATPSVRVDGEAGLNPNLGHYGVLMQWDPIRDVNAPDHEKIYAEDPETGEKTLKWRWVSPSMKMKMDIEELKNNSSITDNATSVLSKELNYFIFRKPVGNPNTVIINPNLVFSSAAFKYQIRLNNVNISELGEFDTIDSGTVDPSSGQPIMFKVPKPVELKSVEGLANGTPCLMYIFDDENNLIAKETIFAISSQSVGVVEDSDSINFISASSARGYNGKYNETYLYYGEHISNIFPLLLKVSYEGSSEVIPISYTGHETFGVTVEGAENFWDDVTLGTEKKVITIGLNGAKTELIVNLKDDPRFYLTDLSISSHDDNKPAGYKLAVSDTESLYLALTNDSVLRIYTDGADTANPFNKLSEEIKDAFKTASDMEVKELENGHYQLKFAGGPANNMKKIIVDNPTSYSQNSGRVRLSTLSRDKVFTIGAASLVDFCSINGIVLDNIDSISGTDSLDLLVEVFNINNDTGEYLRVNFGVAKLVRI